MPISEKTETDLWQERRQLCGVLSGTGPTEAFVLARVFYQWQARDAAAPERNRKRRVIYNNKRVAWLLKRGKKADS